MRSLIKTSLRCFLLTHIVCVTCAPKTNILFFGSQSSTSREEEEEEEDIDLKHCKMALFAAFQNSPPLSNFFHALFYLNKDNFKGPEAFTTDTAQGYYLDLLNTALDLNLPRILGPHEFCSKYHRLEKDDCIRTIEEAGCGAYVKGVYCLDYLYRNWKKSLEPDPEALPGTERLSDEELREAIAKGSGSVENFSDEDLLEDYFSQNGSCEYSDEDSSGNYYWQIEEHKKRQNALYEARCRRYGIGESSYANICEEYSRRQSLPKEFDSFYAKYLYRKVKNCDDSKFKSRHDYCVNYLKEKRNQLELQNFELISI